MYTCPHEKSPLPTNAKRLAVVYNKKKEFTMTGKQYDIFKIKPKILVVEDTPILQLVFTKLLEMLGCEIELAKDGFEAIKKFNQDYALILLDIGLPGMNGIQTVVTLRPQEQAKRIPIIGMTACDEQIKDECLNAGMDDLFIKPILFDTLGQILQRWLIP